MSADLALALRGVGAAVGGFELHDVTMALPTGYVMGFVGPNGAGKTTTIRCLLGMLAHRSGEIELLGRPVPGPVEVREDVGVVLDRPCLVGDWRLTQVQRALRPFYRRWDPARYLELLERFELDPRAKVKHLSRGMGMKLAIAVALSHHARLLVLDEPTSGLDPIVRDDLVRIVGDYLTDERHSVLFSTHITTDLERIADYVTLISHGRIVRSAAKDDLLAGYRLVRGGPDQLRDPVGVELLGVRRTTVGVQALVPTEQVDLLDAGLVVEAPTLEEIVVHVGAQPRVPAAAPAPQAPITAARSRRTA